MARALVEVIRFILLEQFSLMIRLLLPIVLQKLLSWFIHGLKLTAWANSLNELIVELFSSKAAKKRRQQTLLLFSSTQSICLLGTPSFLEVHVSIVSSIGVHFVLFLFDCFEVFEW